jgi:tetratricopeptide (TPR) repeat protein
MDSSSDLFPEDFFHNTLVERFEEMLRTGDALYFDSDELEEIFEYYIVLRKHKEAAQVIETAKSQHPYSTSLKIREAELYLADNDFKRAEFILRKIEAEASGFPEYFVTKAQIYNQQKLHHKSIYYLKKALELAGNESGDILIQLAYQYCKTNEVKKVKMTLKRFVSQAEFREDALFEVTNFFEFNEMKTEGVDFLKNYIDEDPYSTMAWYNLGNLYSAQREHEEAIEAYDYALICDEKFSSAYFNKANTLARLERYEEAIQVYQATLKFEEPSALTYYYIGECYEQSGSFQNAYTYYYKAVKCDKNFADAWLGIGISLDNMNRLTEGIHYIKKALSLEPENSDFWYVLAEIERKLGFLEEARYAYEKVIELDEFNTEVYMDFSGMYYQHELWNEAMDVIKRGIHNHPEEYELSYRLSAYLYGMRRRGEAEEILRTVLSRSSNGMTEMLDYMPEMKADEYIQELIDLYREE